MTPKRFLAYLLLPLLWSCSGEKSPTGLYTPSDDSWAEVLYTGDLGDSVVVQIESDPPSLHPTNGRTTYRDLILGLTYQRLHFLDLTQPGNLYPSLAVGQPVPLRNDSTYSVTIHPDAVWPDGSPVTAKDVIFTIKAVGCPLTQNGPQKSYLEYLTDVREDPGNPKVVHFDFREYYMNNKNISILSYVLDARKFDPEGTMAAIPVRDFLGESAAKLEADPKVVAWASFFNDGKLGRDLEWLNAGSGPYKVVSWVPEQSIVLERRENYWGKDLPGYAHRATPPRIIFRMIQEDATLELQIKEQRIDIAYPSVQSYQNLLESELVREHYRMDRPAKTSIAVIAWNLRPEAAGRAPIFNDVRVRRAVAMAIPLDSMLVQHFPLAQQRAVSPVSPSNADHNDTIRPIPHQPALAAQLLKEAGWADSDNNGYLDRVVNGKQVELSFELMFSPNSDAVVAIMNRMEQELAKVGIRMVQKTASMQEYLPLVNKHEFDAALFAFGSSDLPYDFKQLFHSDSWGEQGSNMFGYRDSTVDAWIDQARVERDPARREELVNLIQAKLYQDQPMLFFFHPRSEVIVHRRFSGATFYPVTPHLIINALEVKR